MVCFIILHYMVIDETIKCVESLEKLDGDKKIIIVDNASSNGSGEELKKKYLNNNNIDIVINKENLGFAKGNNIGCEFAKDKYDSDFYIVINNDILINQNDFISRIYTIYKNEPFDVLGPKVFCPPLGVFQSPKRIKGYDYEEFCKELEKYNKRNKNKAIVRIKCFIKKIPGIKKFIYLCRSKKKNIDYEIVYHNVPLHGSCLIFSKEFIAKRKKPFYDKTFMYFESEILDYECRKFNYIELYSPEINVVHNHNASTNSSFESEYKKTLFMNEQIKKSLESFINDMN